MEFDANARGLFSDASALIFNQPLVASDWKATSNGYNKQFLYFLGVQVASARLQFKLIG